MKIHVTFYKHVSDIGKVNDVQHNFLSIKPLLSLLAAFFVEKTRFLSKIFSNSEFGMRVFKGKIEARNESTFLYVFLRISPRKINILKKTKLGPKELIKVNDINVKKDRKSVV